MSVLEAFIETAERRIADANLATLLERCRQAGYTSIQVVNAGVFGLEVHCYFDHLTRECFAIHTDCWRCCRIGGWPAIWAIVADMNIGAGGCGGGGCSGTHNHQVASKSLPTGDYDL